MVRVGIVGYGFIGQVHAASWRELGVEVHVFTDPPIGQLPTALPDLTFHHDFDSLAAAVDLVDVCVPTFLHAQFVIRAAAAGRHVLCEKPIANTLEDAASMVAAVADNGTQLHVGHVVRWFPEYAAARAAVVDGRIGRVGVIRLARESSPPDRPPNNWLFDQKLSGGVIGDLMIHDMDYARWIAGDVARVYTRAVGDPLDHAYVILTHRSGVLTHLTGSWSQPEPTFRTRFEIAGDRGLITFDSATDRPLDLALATGEQVGSVGLPPGVGAGSPFTRELADVMAAVSGGAPLRVGTGDAIAALRIALAALDSAHSGAAVELDPKAAT
jgi:myo-inositol 2-dehydrogenase / D-chiro-inositol 1-dehydrogenase